MTKLKVFNVEFDGIDKCGKDLIKSYIFHLAPGKYLAKARGVISQLAYARLFGRELDFDITDYAKSTLFVLLDVDYEDWKIRCKITAEPKLEHSFSETRAQFFKVINLLHDVYNVPISHLMIFDTSSTTPYEIACEVISRLKTLNLN